MGDCKPAVKGWWVGCESDELCKRSRVARFGERNGAGEEKAKPPSARQAERCRGIGHMTRMTLRTYDTHDLEEAGE